jgi:hypothetical protein
MALLFIAIFAAKVNLGSVISKELISASVANRIHEILSWFFELAMFGLRWEEHQVLNAVVGMIPVDVVNYFLGREFSADVLLHYVAIVVNGFPVHLLNSSIFPTRLFLAH